MGNFSSLGCKHHLFCPALHPLHMWYNSHSLEEMGAMDLEVPSVPRYPHPIKHHTFFIFYPFLFCFFFLPYPKSPTLSKQWSRLPLYLLRDFEQSATDDKAEIFDELLMQSHRQILIYTHPPSASPTTSKTHTKITPVQNNTTIY